jgi:hypothetical protein
MDAFLVVLACILLVAVEFAVVLAILAPQAIVRFTRSVIEKLFPWARGRGEAR